MLDFKIIVPMLHSLFPSSEIKKFDAFWPEVMAYAEITDENRFSMFVGQVGIECGGFTKFVEGLNYKPSRLIDVWPSRFRLPREGEDPNMDIFFDGKRNALRYAGQPEKLANYVYGGRMGNRDESSGDGYRFRGRGPKQITGARNYVDLNTDLGKKLKVNFIKNPDSLLSPKEGLYSAGWYWKKNNINRYADAKDNRHVTYIVNGGYTDVAKRGLLYDKTLKMIA